MIIYSITIMPQIFYLSHCTKNKNYLSCLLLVSTCIHSSFIWELSPVYEIDISTHVL